MLPHGRLVAMVVAAALLGSWVCVAADEPGDSQGSPTSPDKIGPSPYSWEWAGLVSFEYSYGPNWQEDALIWMPEESGPYVEADVTGFLSAAVGDSASLEARTDGAVLYEAGNEKVLHGFEPGEGLEVTAAIGDWKVAYGSYTVGGVGEPFFGYHRRLPGWSVDAADLIPLSFADLSLNFFGASGQHRQYFQVFQHDSIGLYRLAHRPIEPASELLTVFVIRGDRWPGEVQSARILQPGHDYLIDYASGAVTLLDPSPPVTLTDETVWIAVHYEQRSDRLAVPVLGGRADLDLSLGPAKIALGIGTVREGRDPASPDHQLTGIQVAGALGSLLHLRGEYVLSGQDEAAELLGEDTQLPPNASLRLSSELDLGLLGFTVTKDYRGRAFSSLVLGPLGTYKDALSGGVRVSAASLADLTLEVGTLALGSQDTAIQRFTTKAVTLSHPGRIVSGQVQASLRTPLNDTQEDQRQRQSIGGALRITPLKTVALEASHEVSLVTDAGESSSEYQSGVRTTLGPADNSLEVGYSLHSSGQQRLSASWRKGLVKTEEQNQDKDTVLPKQDNGVGLTVTAGGSYLLPSGTDARGYTLQAGFEYMPRPTTALAATYRRACETGREEHLLLLDAYSRGHGPWAWQLHTLYGTPDGYLQAHADFSLPLSGGIWLTCNLIVRNAPLALSAVHKQSILQDAPVHSGTSKELQAGVEVLLPIAKWLRASTKLAYHVLEQQFSSPQTLDSYSLSRSILAQEGLRLYIYGFEPFVYLRGTWSSDDEMLAAGYDTGISRRIDGSLGAWRITAGCRGWAHSPMQETSWHEYTSGFYFRAGWGF